MLKAVVLLKRKAGLSSEQFTEHYEKRHVPLVRQLLPTIGRYVRNYVTGGSLTAQRQAGGAAERPYFDVITELWFETQLDYDRFLAALADPETSRRLQEDEDRFLDRSVVQTFPVAEFVS